MHDATAAKYGQRSLLIEHSAGRVVYTHILNLALRTDAPCERVHICIRMWLPTVGGRDQETAIVVPSNLAVGESDKFGGSNGSWFDGSVASNVIVSPRVNTDVRRLAVRQVTQLGSKPHTFAPLQKCNPIFFERINLRLCRCRSQLGNPVDRAHGRVLFGLFHHAKVPQDAPARLTGGLHFSYRRLILGVATDAGAPDKFGSRLKEWTLALSLRGVRIRH